MVRANSEYRPDIDGLRAVAVVPVVLFHAGFEALGGGYVGVDIFFVISGYLISQILVADIDTNQFTLAKFYDRRVRRILPALLTVIAFCIAAAYWVFTPADFKDLGESIIATIFFISNIYFWRKTNYFDPTGNEQPLLHTWSLSIEEQFYLGYPLLLALLSKKRRLRVILLSIFCLLSFLSSVILVYYKPSATFYLGPTRVWELLFGGLICLAGPKVELRSSFRAVVACLGLMLILIPILTYSPATRFPGMAALPPVFGSGLLIWSGIASQTPVHRILAAGPFTSIGKASYSLYLWHFPLLVFASYAAGGKLSLLAAALICVIAIGISFVSLRFVEKPFRFPKGRSSLHLSSALIGGCATVGLALLIIVAEGIPGRMDKSAQTYLYAEKDRAKSHTECLSLAEVIVRPKSACRFGVTNVQPSVLLWGDSHAMVNVVALEKAALRNNAAFLFAGSVDCPIGLDFSIDPLIGPEFVATPAYQYCGQYNLDMLKVISENTEITTVVLSSRWTNWRIGEPGSASEGNVDIRLRSSRGSAASKEENKVIFAEGFEKLISTLDALGKTIWIVGPVPEPSVRVPKALYIRQFGFDRANHDIDRSVFVEKNKWIFALFQNLIQKYPLNFIWPHAVLCTVDVCPVSENGQAMFFDNNHLSMIGVLKTAELYDGIFKSRLQGPKRTN